MKIRITAAAILMATGHAWAQMPPDLAGHNHISEIAHLGSADEQFGKELLNLMRSVR